MRLKAIADNHECVLVIGSFKESKDNNRDRALDIISLLSIMLLIQSNFNNTCFFLSDYDKPKSLNLYDIDSNGFNDLFFKKSNTSTIPISCSASFLAFSRDDIHRILINEDFKDYYNILKTKYSKHSFLLNSSHNIYLSLLYPNPEMQLVSCISSIEILLDENDSGGKYDKIQGRLKELIGNQAYMFFNDNFQLNYKDIDTKRNLFDLRHLILHEGKTIPSELSHIALRLSVITLLKFSKEIQKFKCKGEYLSFLDTKRNNQNYYKKVEFSEFLKRWSELRNDNEVITLPIYYLYNYYTSYREDISETNICKAIKSYSRMVGKDEYVSFQLFTSLIIEVKKYFDNYNAFTLYSKDVSVSDSDIKLIKDYESSLNLFGLE